MFILGSQAITVYFSAHKERSLRYHHKVARRDDQPKQQRQLVNRNPSKTHLFQFMVVCSVCSNMHHN